MLHEQGFRRRTVNKCASYYNSFINRNVKNEIIDLENNLDFTRDENHFLKKFEDSFKTSIIETVCLTFLKLNTGYIEEFILAMDKIYDYSEELFENLMIAHFLRPSTDLSVIDKLIEIPKYKKTIIKFLIKFVKNMIEIKSYTTKNKFLFDLLQKYKNEILFVKISSYIDKIKYIRDDRKFNFSSKRTKIMKFNIMSDNKKHNIEFAEYINKIYDKQTKIVSFDPESKDYYENFLLGNDIVISDKIINTKHVFFININTHIRYSNENGCIFSNSEFFKHYFAEKLNLKKTIYDIIDLEIDSTYKCYKDIVEKHMYSYIRESSVQPFQIPRL